MLPEKTLCLQGAEIDAALKKVIINKDILNRARRKEKMRETKRNKKGETKNERKTQKRRKEKDGRRRTERKWGGGEAVDERVMESEKI